MEKEVWGMRQVWGVGYFYLNHLVGADTYRVFNVNGTDEYLLGHPNATPQIFLYSFSEFVEVTRYNRATALPNVQKFTDL